MHQHERVHSTFRDHGGGDNSLAESSGRAHDTSVVWQHSGDRDLLVGPQRSDEAQIKWLTHKSLIF